MQFSYPSRPDTKILKGLNLVFQEGKTTAIVGATGSGKSTIIQLLERFYEPDSGTVLIGGYPLTKLNIT